MMAPWEGEKKLILRRRGDAISPVVWEAGEGWRLEMRRICVSRASWWDLRDEISSFAEECSSLIRSLSRASRFAICACVPCSALRRELRSDGSIEEMFRDDAVKVIGLGGFVHRPHSFDSCCDTIDGEPVSQR